MGNAESAPKASPAGPISPTKHRHSRRQKLKPIAEGSNEDPLSSGSYDNDNDDWDYGMTFGGSNENLSPNHHRQQQTSQSGGNNAQQQSPRGKAGFSPKHQNSPRRRVPRDPEERLMSDDSDDDHSYDMTVTSALMEASAAVFQYLTNGGEMDHDDSGYSLSDDSSIAERSAAVFDHLQQEAISGNEEPMIQFLETAQVVSDVLLKEQEYGHHQQKQQQKQKQEPRQTYLIPQNYHDDNEDDDAAEKAVSQQRIVQALIRGLEENRNKNYDGNEDNHDNNRKENQYHVNPTRRSPNMMQWLETKPDQDTQSVISEMSNTIFKVLDDTKQRVNEEGVAEFSAAVHDLLEDAGKKKKMMMNRKQKESGAGGGDWDNDSISEHSAAIFKILDKTAPPDVSLPGTGSAIVPPPSEPRQGRAMTFSSEKSYISHLKPRTDPTKLMQRNIFHILAQRNKESMPRTIREEEIIHIEDVTDVEEPSSQQSTEPEKIDVTNVEEPEDLPESLPPLGLEAKNTEGSSKEPSPTPDITNSQPQEEESSESLPPLGLAANEEPPQPAATETQAPRLPPLRRVLKEAELMKEAERMKETAPKPIVVAKNNPLLCFAPKEQPSSPVVAAAAAENPRDKLGFLSYEYPSDLMMEPPVLLFSEEIHADSSDQELQEIQDEIDLNFVERFDYAFNVFIGLHPRFLLNSPDLVHHLRIAKLQKLLEHMDEYENDLLSKLGKVKSEKETMEHEFQYELREASRDKATSQIALQSELAAVTQKTHFKRAQITWKIVNSSEARAKKDYIFRQNQKKKRDIFARENISGIPSREELLQLLPHDEEGIKLKAAISAERRFFSYEQEEKIQLEEMRQYQVDNAFMSSEITVLKKKMTDLQAQAKRLSWVDSILLRMDKVQMARLKKKFTNKLGVVSLDE